MIPKYLNCRNEKLEHCFYFIHRDCPETCAYAKDIRGINAKGKDKSELTKKLNKNNTLTNL